MITLTKIRDLYVPRFAGGAPVPLSAASGIVCLGSLMYVIADDELGLGLFSIAGDEPGQMIQLFDGVLPQDKAARKRQKPDLEVLMHLPMLPGFRAGALLAIGSGSRPNREKGALLGLDVAGAPSGSPQILDLAPIFTPLKNEFAEVNIEGAVVVRDELRLFQRGNKGSADNGIIRLSLSASLAVFSGERTAAVIPSRIDRVALGHAKGVPFSFTDAAVLPSGAMVCAAVAEDTDDAYNDGACVGAALAIINDDGVLRSLRQLEMPLKIEGVHARVNGDRADLLLVTDPDNREVAASLYAASILV